MLLYLLEIVRKEAGATGEEEKEGGGRRQEEEKILYPDFGSVAGEFGSVDPREDGLHGNRKISLKSLTLNKHTSARMRPRTPKQRYLATYLVK